MSTLLARLHKIEAAGIRWHIQPGWEERLLGPRGLRLDEWLRMRPSPDCQRRSAPHCLSHSSG